MIIPIIVIKQVITAILILIALVVLYRSEYGKPVRRKVFEYSIRFHGRPAAFRRAMRKANRLSKKRNKRYRVYFLNRRYRVYHRDDIREKKRSGLFNHNVNVTNMQPIEFYDTKNLHQCLSRSAN